MRPFLRRIFCSAVLSLLLAVAVTLPSQAQHIVLGGKKFKAEVGLNFGPSFFLGDLGGNRGKGTRFLKDLNLELTTLMKGGFVTLYPNNWLGFRIAGQFTFITDKDEIIKPQGGAEDFRYERNLDFKTNMWEVYTAIELYPTLMFNQYEDYDPRLKPYVFFGAGLFHFNPKGSLTDANGNTTWHELHPLRTEGQGMAEYPNSKPYKLTQMNIPFGAGLKYDLSDRVTVGTELLYRKTFTDYIDDLSTRYIDPRYFDVYLTPQQAAIAKRIHDKTASNIPTNRTIPGEQRGNSKNMDAYFSTVVKLGIKLGNSGLDKGSLRQTRCPLLY